MPEGPPGCPWLRRHFPYLLYGLLLWLPRKPGARPMPSVPLGQAAPSLFVATPQRWLANSSVSPLYPQTCGFSSSPPSSIKCSHLPRLAFCPSPRLIQNQIPSIHSHSPSLCKPALCPVLRWAPEHRSRICLGAASSKMETQVGTLVHHSIEAVSTCQRDQKTPFGGGYNELQ